MSNASNEEEVAAGGVILIPDVGEVLPGAALKVLLIHRPKYDDWSFPKGKLNDGEAIDQAALREVFEETGLECRIIRPLVVCRYRYRRRKTDDKPKAVHYFLMEPLNDTLSVDGDEVDRAEWLSTADAARILTYRMDRETLDSLIEKGVR